MVRLMAQASHCKVLVTSTHLEQSITSVCYQVKLFLSDVNYMDVNIRVLPDYKKWPNFREYVFHPQIFHLSHVTGLAGRALNTQRIMSGKSTKRILEPFRFFG